MSVGGGISKKALILLSSVLMPYVVIACPLLSHCSLMFLSVLLVSSCLHGHAQPTFFVAPHLVTMMSAATQITPAMPSSDSFSFF